MISLRRKILIAIILFTTLLIVGDLLWSRAHSSSAVTSSVLKLKKLALAVKQPATKQAAAEQVEKEETAKEKAAAEQAAKAQAAKEEAAKEQAAKEQAEKAQALAAQQQAQQQAVANSKLLDVPIINQLSAPQLYNGCEVTSLAMILNYNGYHVTKNQLASQIKTVPLTYQNGLKGNPNDGFVGNMQAGPGYAVYNGPVYNLAKIYAGNKAVNLTNSSFADLLTTVSQGEPVWVITTGTFAPVSDFKTWRTPEGTIQITFSEHSVVITGYDQNYIYINNPYGQKNQRVNRANFEKAWVQMGKQAIVIEK